MPERFQLHPKVAGALALWCATVFLGAAIVFGLHAAHNARVAEREQQTTGNVYAPGRWNHGPVYKYKFTLPGRSDVAGASRTPGNAHFALGQSVTVYYDPKNPRTNSLISFAQAQPNYLMICLSLCSSVVLAAYGVIQWSRAGERVQV